uniref:SHSP domain-containing protein n=2 Tax=Clytia hemisphaerica TaxID=252671 RepID=A0A7M5V3S4_9CNID
MPSIYDRQAPINIPPKPMRRESSRERDRLYRELVGHEPYRPLMKSHIAVENNDGRKFQIKLDVTHYRPDEITMKVDGKSLIISGKHHNQTENGFESSEFQRKYDIPDDINSHTLTSNITPAGILCIEGVRVGKKPTASTSSIEVKDDSFHISLEVGGYSPDEISVRVNHRELVIHGERKDEENHDEIGGKSIHHQQFTRRFVLPDDVDPDSLSSRYSKDMITVVAPRKTNKDTNMRKIEIVDESKEEK